MNQANTEIRGWQWFLDRAVGILMPLIFSRNFISFHIKMMLVLFMISFIMAFHPLITHSNRNKLQKGLGNFHQVMVCIKIWSDACFDRAKGVFNAPLLSQYNLAAPSVIR